MAASWQTDQGAAVTQAQAWLQTTADAKGWTLGWVSAGEAYILQADRDVSWWASGADAAEEFWANLYSTWSTITEKTSSAPTGWDALASTWRSASGSAAAAVREEEAGSAATIVAGTVSGSAETVKKASDLGGKVAEGVAKAAEQPVFWVLVAAAAAAIAARRL